MTMPVTIAMVTSIAMSVIVMHVMVAMFTMLPILWNVNIVIPSVPYEVDRAAACIISIAIS